MKYFIIVITFIFFIIAMLYYVLNFVDISDNSLSAYYNTNGSFAGFIQKKNGLIEPVNFRLMGLF